VRNLRSQPSVVQMRWRQRPGIGTNKNRGARAALAGLILVAALFLHGTTGAVSLYPVWSLCVRDGNPEVVRNEIARGGVGDRCRLPFAALPMKVRGEYDPVTRRQPGYTKPLYFDSEGRLLSSGLASLNETAGVDWIQGHTLFVNSAERASTGLGVPYPQHSCQVSLPPGERPHKIRVGPRGHLALVQTRASVHVLSPQEERVVREYHFASLLFPVFSPDGERVAFVLVNDDRTLNQLVVVNSHGQVLYEGDWESAPPVELQLRGSGSGFLFYVSSESSGEIVRSLDLTTQEVLPWGIAGMWFGMSASGDFLAVVNSYAGRPPDGPEPHGTLEFFDLHDKKAPALLWRRECGGLFRPVVSEGGSFIAVEEVHRGDSGRHTSRFLVIDAHGQEVHRELPDKSRIFGEFLGDRYLIQGAVLYEHPLRDMMYPTTAQVDLFYLSD
jgi:hypothetical protein